MSLYKELIDRLTISVKDINKQRKLNIQQTNFNIKQAAEKQIEEMEFWTIKESLKKEK